MRLDRSPEQPRSVCAVPVHMIPFSPVFRPGHWWCCWLWDLRQFQIQSVYIFFLTAKQSIPNCRICLVSAVTLHTQVFQGTLNCMIHNSQVSPLCVTVRMYDFSITAPIVSMKRLRFSGVRKGGSASRNVPPLCRTVPVRHQAIQRWPWQRAILTCTT